MSYGETPVGSKRTGRAAIATAFRSGPRPIPSRAVRYARGRTGRRREIPCSHSRWLQWLKGKNKEGPIPISDPKKKKKKSCVELAGWIGREREREAYL